MSTYVVVLWNTDHEGKRVPSDMPDEDRPRSYYGPFTSQDSADNWMMHGYPGDDQDVYDMYTIDTDGPSALGHVNTPEFITDQLEGAAK